MKHARMIAFLLMSCAPMSSLVAMDFNKEDGIPLNDLQPIYNGKHQDTLKKETFSSDATIGNVSAIDRVHAEITKKIIRTGFLGFIYSLTQEQHFELLKIVDKHFKNITQEEIENLQQKNSLFKETITHFCELAKRNINDVTCKTLAAVRNPALPQPILQLNELSAGIKKYVIEAAQRDLVHSYDAEFKGHTATVICVDMHVTKDCAVSGGNDGIRLWKFSTGKQLHCFSAEGTEPQGVRFNEACSRLAVIADFKQEQQVKIWDIASKQLLYTIPQQLRFKALSFAGENDEKLVILNTKYFSLYKLLDNAAFVCQEQIKMYIPDGTKIAFDHTCRKNCTEARHLNGDLTAWVATNKSHELYLHKRLLLNAVVKSPAEFPDSIADIEKTSMYRSFGDRERKIANEFATQKRAGTLR